MHDLFYQNAIAFLKQGMLTDALRAFEKSLSIKPDFLEARYEYANALLEAGQTEPAVELLEEICVTRPDFALAHESLLRLYVANGQTQMALKHLETLVGDATVPDDVLGSVFQMLMAHKMQEQAIPLASRLSELPLKDGKLLLKVANLMRSVGRFDKAIEAYRKALRILPGHLDAGLNLAKTYKDAGQYEAALAQYDRMLEQYPNEYEFQYEKALIFIQFNQLDQVQEIIEFLDRQAPNLPASYHLKAKMLAKQGETHAALELYDYLIRVQPQQPQYYIDKARLLFNVGHIQPALDLLEHALEMAPSYSLYYEQGLILSHQRRWDEAARSFRASVQSNPFFPDSLIALGDAYEHLDNYAQARDVYRKAVTLDPDHIPARYRLFHALCKLNENDSAMDELEVLTEMESEERLERLKLRLQTSNLDQYELALQLIQKALESNPRIAKTWYYKAMFYAGLRDKDGFVNALKRAIDLNPNLIEEAELEEMFEHYQEDYDFMNLLNQRRLAYLAN
jgi:tetratricopeptide (TPR) repeat protein